MPEMTEERDPTVHEEMRSSVQRATVGITEELVKSGVREDAAVRAVREQVSFGLYPGDKLVMKRESYITSPSARREMADRIKSSLPPEDMQNYVDEEAEEARQWERAQKALADVSNTYSRAELRDQKRLVDGEKAIARAQGIISPEDAAWEETIARKRNMTGYF